MVKFCAVIFLSTLLFSSSAKPFRPREKISGKVVQDTIDALNLPNVEMIQGMKEVPAKNMDIMDFNISPDMLIWKAVKGENQPMYNKPEEDKDDVYHSIDIKPQADLDQPENYHRPQEHIEALKYEKPEEDRDDLYHREFKAAEEPMGKENDETDLRIYVNPEEDNDEIYHPDISAQQPEHQVQPIKTLSIRPKKFHTEPEVDLDEIYHRQ